MNNFVDLLISLPELFLVLTAMGMMVIGVYTSAAKAYTLINNAAVLSLFTAIGLVLFAKTGTKLAFNDLFISDDFAQYIKVILLLAAALVILIGDRAVRKIKIAHFEYPILITFATIGMMLMVSANDLMSLYVGLELQSLALYVVAALNRDSLRSSEAGLKYFVLGALSSGMLLYGCSLIYGYAGTTSFTGLETMVAGTSNVSLGLLTGLVFLIVGLAFKVAAVPFHMWTPDVYQGSPTSVTSFFSVVKLKELL